MAGRGKKPLVNLVMADLGDPLRGRALMLRTEPVSRLGHPVSVAIAESFGEYASMCFAAGRVK